MKDFTNYAGLEENFENIDVACYCIGVYTGAVNREKFREITVDYTIAFADLLKKKSPDATVCFLSGAGSDQSEKSRMMFAKDKGVAENYIVNLGMSKVHTFRPGYIYPVAKRKEPNFSYRLSRRIYPLMKLLMPNRVITSEELALAMFKVGMKGGKQFVYENKDIKQIVVK